jgi:hypothetical protein
LLQLRMCGQVLQTLELLQKKEGGAFLATVMYVGIYFRDVHGLEKYLVRLGPVLFFNVGFPLKMLPFISTFRFPTNIIDIINLD